MPGEKFDQKLFLYYKTGKGIYPEYELQVAAYLTAYKTKYIKNLLRGKLNVGPLHLGVCKCGYSLKFVDSPLKSFKHFLNVKKTWHLTNPSANNRLR